LTGYDAVYVALASALDARLTTPDRGGAGAPGLEQIVECV
jgi:predicted nucleic acid-binding protein